jgi:hypothetical protein
MLDIPQLLRGTAMDLKGLDAMIDDMKKDENQYSAFKHERFKLPEGMTWQKAREAQAIIEKWEETPGCSDIDLAISLYLLFSKD